jgi:hypothetical protein
MLFQTLEDRMWSHRLQSASIHCLLEFAKESCTTHLGNNFSSSGERKRYSSKVYYHWMNIIFQCYVLCGMWTLVYQSLHSNHKIHQK